MSTTNPLGLPHRLGEAYSTWSATPTSSSTRSPGSPRSTTVSNSWREIGRMLLSDGHDAEAWSGHAGIDKSVAWIEAFPLAGLRAAARAHGATLNDVLLAAVSLALTDYLAERGIDEVTDLSWMMPVSLEPIDAALPDRLGNHFVVVMLSMPLGIERTGRTDRRDPSAHDASQALRRADGGLRVPADRRRVACCGCASHHEVLHRQDDRAADQRPGPAVAMTLAGAPVRSILGWVPTSGDQPLGVSLFSYDDTLSVGVATDARMIPDPLHFVELVERHLAELAQRPPTREPDNRCHHASRRPSSTSRSKATSGTTTSVVSLGGHRFRLIRVGTSGDAAAAEDLVWRWSLDADAIAVSGIREARAAGHVTGRIEDLQRIKDATSGCPVRDDSLLTDILQEWAIRRVEAEMPGYFANARVVVVGGTTRERTVAVLREFTDNIVFDEADHDLVLPGKLKTNPVTAAAAGLGEFAWRQIPGFVKEQVAGPFDWFSDKVAHVAVETPT
jgi:hypothetical protein